MNITEEQRAKLKRALEVKHKMDTKEKKIGYNAGICDTLFALGIGELFVEIKQEIIKEQEQEGKV